MDIPKVRFGYWFVCFTVRTVFRFLCGLRLKGKGNIPAAGPFILASNHKSWFDPPLVGSSCPREIHFAAKKELFQTPILGRLISYLNSIPVKRSGFDREALVRLGEALEKGGAIVIFPEGTRYLDDRLHPPKAGVGLMAMKYDVPIVPVFVANSANIRRQIFRRKVAVTFGKPFHVADIPDLPEGKEAYQAIADEVMRRIAEVGGVPAPVRVIELVES